MSHHKVVPLEKDVTKGKHANIYVSIPESPFASEGQEIGALLRRKAADEEFQPILEKIQSEATQRGLDPLVASTDAFVTAVCWVGSKSLSHVLACIDRTKGRLLDVGAASAEARAQIMSAVMSYWHAHPGIALSIVEKLLNYSILTPFSVVDWALVDNAPANGSNGGLALGEPYVFELVSNTVTKVTGRARQVLSSPDADEETKSKEIKAMRDLFSAINGSLVRWAEGTNDGANEGNGSPDQAILVQRWGQRWLRVFQRLSAIEEAFVLESGKWDVMVTSNGANDS